MHRPPYRRRHRRLVDIIEFIVIIVFFYYLLFGIQIWLTRRPTADLLNGQTLLKERTFDKSVVEGKTDKGMVFWLMEDHSVPIVALGFVFQHVGSVYEPRELGGLTALAVDILPYGGGRYTRTEMSDLFDLNGIRLSLSSTKKDVTGMLVFPSARQDRAGEALHAILTDPRLDEEDLAISKRQALETLRLKRERPEKRLTRYFYKSVFADHPYADDPNGTPESIQAVTRENMKAFLRDSLTQDRLIIGIAGDLTQEEASALVDDIFGDLPQQGITRAPEDPIPDVSPDHNVFVSEDVAQTFEAFATHGTTRSAKDFYPLYIANYVFGGSGMTARLFREARGKKGLTYGISTWLKVDENAPLLVGMFSTTPENYEEMRRILHREWLKFGEKGVTQDEFETAKRHLKTSLNLRFNSTASLADMLLSMQKYNLGIDFLTKRDELIQSVTLEDVNEAARRYYSILPREIALGKFNNNGE